MTPDNATTTSSTSRRRYDSPVRRQRAAQTRERIIASGVELVHSFTSWDWTELTFRAIAERAGVSESTVYRHFANERELQDAVMGRLHELADVNYEGITLDQVGDIAAQVITAMTTFAASPLVAEPTDPAISSIDDVRRQALVDAVAHGAPQWSVDDQRAAAAILDVLWSPLVSERLIAHWNADPSSAIRTMQWAIDLIVRAIRGGQSPTA